VLVTSQYGYSANLERIMKAQAFADPSRAQFMLSKKTMEINPRHPLVVALKERAAADPEAVSADNRDVANLLFDAALLNSGFSIDDPKEFSGRLFRTLKSGLSIESLELVPEVEVAVEEEAAPAEEEEDVEDIEDAGAEEGEAVDGKEEL